MSTRIDKEYVLKNSCTGDRFNTRFGVNEQPGAIENNIEIHQQSQRVYIPYGDITNLIKALRLIKLEAKK